MLKYVLLGGLSYYALTGYELKQWVERAAKNFWYAQTSQIYRTLDMLEKEGLLTSETVAEKDHRDRRRYTITPRGKAVLIDWLKQPMTEVAPIKDELIVRLFFSANLDKQTVLTQLRLQRALHERQLAYYQTDIPAMIAESQVAAPHLKRDALMWDCARRNGELLEETYVRWLDETIQRIEAEY